MCKIHNEEFKEKICFIQDMSLKQQNGTTRSVTYRIPSDIAENLKNEAIEKNLSTNALVNRIFKKYLNGNIPRKVN